MDVMLKPILLENDQWLVHAFRSDDLGRYERMAGDLFSILSDEHTLRYLPEKRLHTIREAESLLRGMIFGHHAGRRNVYFITAKEQQRVIGMIDILAPDMAREHYRLDHYPHFIEFYLKGTASGRSVMSSILPPIVKDIRQQGIAVIGAAVNRKNYAAKKVLERSGFRYQSGFDLLQDLYICQ